MKYFYFFLMAVTLVNCSHLESQTIASCPQGDWYEVGRQDGLLGLPLDQIKIYEKSCRDESKPLSKDLYTHGRNFGLVQFCSPQNGFSMGQAGQGYRPVCPTHLEQTFRSSYRYGQRVLDLEKENSMIDQKLTDLVAMTDRTPSSESARRPAAPPTAIQVEKLKQARENNQREIGRLKKTLSF